MSPSPPATEGCIWRPTPLAALELPEIPTDQNFVRDHFPVPAVDSDTWLLEIDGETERLLIDLERLRAMPTRSLRVVLECAGHRRAEFDPLPTEGGAGKRTLKPIEADAQQVRERIEQRHHAHGSRTDCPARTSTAA